MRAHTFWRVCTPLKCPFPLGLKAKGVQGAGFLFFFFWYSVLSILLNKLRSSLGAGRSRQEYGKEQFFLSFLLLFSKLFVILQLITGIMTSVEAAGVTFVG